MSTRLVPTCSWLPATADDLQPPSTADHAERKHCISLSVSSRIMLGLCAQALAESVQSKSIPFHVPVVLGHYPENKSSLSVVILWSKPSLVHWNFRSVIDGFPHIFKSFPSALPPLCFHGENWLSSKDNASHEDLSGYSLTAHRTQRQEVGLVASFDFPTLLPDHWLLPTLLQTFCGCESWAIWYTFFQTSPNFLLALLQFFCHLSQYTLFQWIQLWTSSSKWIPPDHTYHQILDLVTIWKLYCFHHHSFRRTTL